MRIMIIDDEQPALDELADLIETLVPDGEVYRFLLPSDAIEMYEQIAPELVFLDIEMPKYKGLQVVERMRAAASVDSEFVFVTAYVQHALAAYDLSIMDYVSKPFEEERIRQTLSRFFKISRRDQSTKSEYSIQLFGNIAINGPHGKVTFTRQKVAHMFAYLVLHGNATVDKMANDLFPESTYDRAVSYVYTCLYQLRKTLNEAGLEHRVSIQYVNKVHELTLHNIKSDYHRYIGTADQKERIALYRGTLCDEISQLWINPYQMTTAHLYEMAIRSTLEDEKRQGNMMQIHYYQMLIDKLECE